MYSAMVQSGEVDSIMARYDGAAIRAMVDTLPPHVFDALVFELPELFDGLEEWQVDSYVHWHDAEIDTPDEVAVFYGYEDMQDMQETGPFVMMYDDGVLVIE